MSMIQKDLDSKYINKEMFLDMNEYRDSLSVHVACLRYLELKAWLLLLLLWQENWLITIYNFQKQNLCDKDLSV